MAVLTLIWRQVSLTEADLLESGAARRNWTYKRDARIKIPSAALGIGPVVYAGTPENPATGAASYDGVVRDALFLFCDTADCVRALLEDVNPEDLAETISHYMDTHGGDIPTMQTLKPVGV